MGTWCGDCSGGPPPCVRRRSVGRFRRISSHRPKPHFLRASVSFVVSFFPLDTLLGSCLIVTDHATSFVSSSVVLVSSCCTALSKVVGAELGFAVALAHRLRLAIYGRFWSSSWSAGAPPSRKRTPLDTA